MREKMQRFMWGRYGTDRFNQFLMVCAMVCLLISFFGGGVFYLVATAVMVYAYFRMFSRNVSKRTLENQWYLKKEMKVRSFFLKKKKELLQSKEYHIYKCPKCKQKIRVPRGKEESRSVAGSAGTSSSRGAKDIHGGLRCLDILL